MRPLASEFKRHRHGAGSSELGLRKGSSQPGPQQDWPKAGEDRLVMGGQLSPLRTGHLALREKDQGSVRSFAPLTLGRDKDWRERFRAGSRPPRSSKPREKGLSRPNEGVTHPSCSSSRGPFPKNITTRGPRNAVPLPWPTLCHIARGSCAPSRTDSICLWSPRSRGQESSQWAP